MIPFNVPPYLPACSEYVEKAIQNRKICGDGPFTRQCSELLEKRTGASKVLLTTSGTSALEMAAILMDIHKDDEVIMPSYTFVSTANAFVLRGAKIVFVDCDPMTMNIDPECIRKAITPRTKAIAVVHYGGVCCDMDQISDIAKEHNLKVIEDAAQAVDAAYKRKPAGTMSNIGCYSFHETKNFSMGEGGAVVINDPNLVERAEIIREKGTDRSRFFRGQVDKYTWVDIGSSFLPSELNAAYLLAQLENHELITANRMASWNRYHQAFAPLEAAGKIRRMYIPDDCQHNAHMYYILTNSLEERGKLIAHLKEHDICAVFHYIPLHSAKAGLTYGCFSGEDRYVTNLSERLVRLPLYYNLKQEDCERVISEIFAFYA